MIGMARRPVCVTSAVACLVTVGLVAFATPTAWATINLTGDVIPSPPAGDPWNVGGQLSVGETLVGTMTIGGGSDVSNTDGYVGNNAGSDGTVTVSGAGSTWSNSGELRMGNAGTGTLNIAAGGVVSVSGNGRIGNVEGGIGTATVDGVGSTLTSDNYILVGRAGNGTLQIQNSGVVSDSIGGIAIFEGSAGMVTINGTGSAWNNLNELQVADGGNATLNILNGGRVSTSLGYLAVSAAGIGTATISGTGSTWTSSSQLQVGYGGSGTLKVLAGGTVASSLGYIGVLATGNGTVTVSGAGSTWTNSSDLQVGYDGAGMLIVQSGAAVSSSVSTLGTNMGSNGTVTVSGIGSTWITSAALSVGSAGTGALNIENGGLVSAEALNGGNATSGIYFNGGTLRITSNGSSSNTMTFTGGGGLDVSTAATTFTLTSNITGAGGLTKLGAGTLTLTGANAYGGDTKIATGTLNIDQAYLKDLADVYLATGASFGLNYSGTDAIDSLFVGGVSQALGTYGGIGSGADFEMTLFSGPGLLRVTSIGIAGDYNDDGAVNSADYVVWRKTDGSQFGYGLWRTNFGKVLGVGAGLPQSLDRTSHAPAPEPASAFLFIMGWGTAITIGRRCRFAISAIDTPATDSGRQRSIDERPVLEH